MFWLLLFLALAIALSGERIARKSREPASPRQSPAEPNGWVLVAGIALGFVPAAGILPNINPQRKKARRPRDGL
jgi:hypothetical protein